MNWHPDEYYRRDHFGVDAVILIETLAAVLLALAMAWVEYLT